MLMQVIVLSLLLSSIYLYVETKELLQRDSYWSAGKAGPSWGEPNLMRG